ncbi:MAG: hypothetical protein ABSE74_06395 [Methanoregula sp.]
MPEKEKHRRTSPGLLQRELSIMLSRALENREDFVLAWEPRPDEEPTPGTHPVAHIMTGNLITSCRLNALLGRVMVYEDEGARSVTVSLNSVRAARQNDSPLAERPRKRVAKKTGQHIPEPDLSLSAGIFP